MVRSPNNSKGHGNDVIHILLKWLLDTRALCLINLLSVSMPRDWSRVPRVVLQAPHVPTKCTAHARAGRAGPHQTRSETTTGSTRKTCRWCRQTCSAAASGPPTVAFTPGAALQVVRGPQHRDVSWAALTGIQALQRRSPGARRSLTPCCNNCTLIRRHTPSLLVSAGGPDHARH